MKTTATDFLTYTDHVARYTECSSANGFNGCFACDNSGTHYAGGNYTLNGKIHSTITDHTGGVWDLIESGRKGYTWSIARRTTRTHSGSYNRRSNTFNTPGCNVLTIAAVTRKAEAAIADMANDAA